ncbi:5'/3'-nucleotidase SurE [Patescibacteria group bacterium]|nr:5'/3'-nucleotidase SurE [Patescibacteria group bacterium]
MKPLILVTNDDGYDSAGILEVAKAAQEYGEVVIAAPKQHQSGMGRAVTVRKPISVEETELEGIKSYIIDGTPASCVIIGLELLDRKPDLVVSGINRGENLAASMTMSGTLSAALEASTYGIPALAFSLRRPTYISKEEFQFGSVAKLTGKFIQGMLDGSIEGRLLNINIPYDADQSTPLQYGPPSRNKLHWPKVSQVEGKYFIDFEKDYRGLEKGSDVDIIVNDNKISVTSLDYMIAAR